MNSRSRKWAFLFAVVFVIAADVVQLLDAGERSFGGVFTLGLAWRVEHDAKRNAHFRLLEFITRQRCLRGGLSGASGECEREENLHRQGFHNPMGATTRDTGQLRTSRWRGSRLP